LRRHLATEKQTLADKKNQILSKAQEDAALTLRKARQEAEDVISQLKAQFAAGDARQRQQTIDGARRRLKESSADVHSLGDGAVERGRLVQPGELTPGAAVFVTSLGQKGSVLVVTGDEVTVQLGIMKLNVPLENCRLLDDAPVKTKTDSRSGVSLAKSQETSRQIDIRGTNIEEAETILDKYLDDAVLAGLDEAIIIHGKGTGALRKGIRIYLKAHRSVKEIHIGEANQGGDGVTVVKLK